jgi:hypothetical protein
VPQPLSAPATVRVFNLDELQMACDHMLEQLWQQWGSEEAVSGSTQLRQYARLFKHWRHLDAKEQYLFTNSIPPQLQHLLLQLRCFNLKLATHVSHWGGRGAQAVGPNCGMCCMHAVESEHHVVFQCPAYTDLRTLYGIPLQSHAAMFTGNGADKTARFLRAVLYRRTNGQSAGVSHVTSRHMLLILCAITVMILLGLTLFGPWTPTGSFVT